MTSSLGWSRINGLLLWIVLGVSAGFSHEGHPVLVVPQPHLHSSTHQTPPKPFPEPKALLLQSFSRLGETVRARFEGDFLLVECDGLPDHPLMAGIRSWQGQVPLPQPYLGENAWRIPLNPRMADQPLSGKVFLRRGAIALAINGVPIFNALNNRGDDAYLAGELDEYGGHCGRADDYHYHIAPLHLQEVAGPGQPIGYALDGYPLYGLLDEEGHPATGLDEFNGKFGKDGRYRYHSTRTYPYVNGGLRGIVEIRGDQVEPQPRLKPIRPAQSPQPGAIVTGWHQEGPDAYRLTFQDPTGDHTVDYSKNQDGSWTFTFVEPNGRKLRETYPLGLSDYLGMAAPWVGGGVLLLLLAWKATRRKVRTPRVV